LRRCLCAARQEAGVKDHRASLSLFEEGAKDAKDPQLKAYFEKHVPHIKQHLAMAQNIAGQADGGDAGKKDRGPAGSKGDREAPGKGSDRQSGAGSGSK
jgi:hypothetical protein